MRPGKLLGGHAHVVFFVGRLDVRVLHEVGGHIGANAKLFFDLFGGGQTELLTFLLVDAWAKMVYPEVHALLLRRAAKEISVQACDCILRSKARYRVPVCV